MLLDKYKIRERLCIITGGGGLLGFQHAAAILEGEGIPVLLDISATALKNTKQKLLSIYPDSTIFTYVVDITDKQ
jgi:FlaA1/EpsC-like NDP-sugar epimerase